MQLSGGRYHAVMHIASKYCYIAPNQLAHPVSPVQPTSAQIQISRGNASQLSHPSHASQRVSAKQSEHYAHQAEHALAHNLHMRLLLSLSPSHRSKRRFLGDDVKRG